MRTEQEMFNTILGIAQADNRVRAVYMSGSRANPAVEKDAYSDYDIVFVVTETQPFLDNATWLLAFGEPAIVQEPDSNQFGWGQDHDCSCSYSWLMLFADGNRIDLSIKTCDCALADYLSDTLCVKLLDKDQVLPDIPPASDVAYHIKPPTAQQYRGCCNEFWWCLNNVAKGIARGQMPYAHKMYMQTVHAELEKMMEWYIGAQHAFKISTGM